MILRLIAILAATTCTIAAAQAAPCTLIPNDTSQRCSSTAQSRQILMDKFSEPTSDSIALYRGGHLSVIEPNSNDDEGVKILRPYQKSEAACSGSIGLIPDFGENARRYEVCLSDLDGEEGLDVAAAFNRISRAVDRTCRANGAGTYPALKFCRRDTLYRAVMDTSLPELTAHYVAETGRSVPRIEVDPAKTY
ncbi:MAG: hypothetical protein Hens3KO_01770 [Henriciella sp.]